jgi:hypothetical protein
MGTGRRNVLKKVDTWDQQEDTHTERKREKRLFFLQLLKRLTLVKTAGSIYYVC